MRGRALLLSNRVYRDKRLAELPSAEADIEVLHRVLADPGIGDFAVATLGEAPCQDWREQIEAFFADAERDETLLLYVSSHAVKDQDAQLYFCATDTNLRRLLATGVSATFIQQSAFRSRSHKQIMLFDSCFAGAFARGYTFKSGDAVGSGEYFREGGGRIVITASDEMQYAFADDGASGSARPSVFTKHLAEGLRSGQADEDGLGVVTVDSLFRYVKQRVVAENPHQSPQIWTFALSGDIVVARNPAPRPAALPPRIAANMVHDDARVRALAATDLAALAQGASESMRLAALAALHTLADDDSRTVSRTAQDALAALGTAVPAPPAAVPVPVPVPAPEPARPPAVASEARPAPVLAAAPAQPGLRYRAGYWLGRHTLSPALAGALLLIYGLLPVVARSTDTVFLDFHASTCAALVAAGALFIVAERWLRNTPLRLLALALAGGASAYRSTNDWWPVELFGNAPDIVLLWGLLLIAALRWFWPARPPATA